MGTAARTSARRGRPRAGERAEREQRVLEVALAERIEQGYDGDTMLRIASRAGASKETLYNWFGGKDGLFADLIERNADASAEHVLAAPDTDAPPRDVLAGYAAGLLGLLSSPGSIALNPAARSAPDLAEVLLAHGRHRAGSIVERYLARLVHAGVLGPAEPADLFELLDGLVVRDTQIRVLLGEPPPPDADQRRRAATAIDQFFALVGV